MTHRLTTIIALLLLGVMAVAMGVTQVDENAIIDEIAHIPSGITYVTEGDMRLNPEHPPLLKDLAGLAVVTWSTLTDTALNLPTDHPSWQTKLNGQWDFGFEFLYNSGNDPDAIVPIARIPMMAVTLLIGWLLFSWTRRRYGNSGGFIAILLYALAPTILAHGRYVTTDVGAMGGFLLGTVTFIYLLKQPSRRNILFAGLGFGIALLLKFSVILLVPLYGALGLLWVVRESMRARRMHRIDDDHPNGWQTILAWTGRFALLAVIAALLIGVVYAPHVWNYPQERQQADIAQNLATHGNEIGVATVKWAANHTLTRPWAQYGLGVLMVTQRVVGGNTTFFLGNINNIGWLSYFPIVYLIKTPLALHILTILAAVVAVRRIRPWGQSDPWYHRLGDWFGNHLEETAALFFLVLYWTVSIRGNLNIGVRHLLPTFPFVYFLISGTVTWWIRNHGADIAVDSPLQMIRAFFVHAARTVGKVALVVLLLIWYTVSSFAVAPHFLAYFNELVGGADEGRNYVVDSNLDWGQDMKRLATFVEQRNIETLKLDYFGGGLPEYYLGDRYVPLQREPTTGWIAVSATLLKGGQANPVDDYVERTGETGRHYMWLAGVEPEAVIGHSILVYHIPERE